MTETIAREQIQVVLKCRVPVWKWIHEVFIVIEQNKVINQGIFQKRS